MNPLIVTFSIGFMHTVLLTSRIQCIINRKKNNKNCGYQNGKHFWEWYKNGFISSLNSQFHFSHRSTMKFCLTLIITISYISLSDACSCAFFKGWELKTYCASSFAGTFEVLGPSYYCGQNQICYPIAVVQQFRGPNVWPTTAKTSDSSAACGVGLTVGNTYFVATNPADANTIGVYMCGLLQDWTLKTCCEMIAEAKKYNCRNINPPILVDPVENAI